MAIRLFLFKSNDIHEISITQSIHVSVVGLIIHHNDNVASNFKRKIISKGQITDLIDIDKRFIEQQNPFQFIQLNKFYFD